MKKHSFIRKAKRGVIPYSRGAHTFSARELLIKWPGKNDLPRGGGGQGIFYLRRVRRRAEKC